MLEVHQIWTAPPHHQHHAQQEQQGYHGESDWEPISELLVLVTQQVAVIGAEGQMTLFILFSFPLERSAEGEK